jgi:PEP-CTERM motif
MRQVLRTNLIMLALLFAICGFTSSAYADSQSATASGGCTGSCNYNGYSFQGTLQSLGGGNYSLTYTVTNNNSTSANNSFVQDWSLTLFSPGPGNNKTVLSGLTGFTVSQDGSDYTAIVGKANNGGGCNAVSDDSVCVSNTSGTPSQLGPHQSITFSLDFTCTGDCKELANWIFLAGGGPCGTQSNGNCFAISTEGVPGPVVPEPSSLLLLGSGLMAAGAFVRHKAGGALGKKRIRA